MSKTKEKEATKTAGPTSVEVEVGGQVMRFETGELAKQAGGAVLVTYGETVVLVTATANEKPKPGVGWFPLTVDYEEKMYAAGKIPGGWIKREGRPPERTTLTSRLIDRPIRPLFEDGFRNDVHVVGMCFSVDGENDPDVLALSGAGAALSLSDIPFEGPVAGVRVGYVDGELVINPTQAQMANSSLNLVVAGTRDSIMMVEAGAYEVSEDLILDAFEEAHEAIKKIIGAIDQLVKKAGKPKKEYPLFIPDADLAKVVKKHMGKAVAKAMRITDKKARNEAFSAISREAMLAALEGGKTAAPEKLVAILKDEKKDDFDTIIKKLQEEELFTMIVDENLRPDGRKSTEIRPLAGKVALMPRTHGSGLFTRGQTQILTLCTLGTLAEEQNFDNVIGEVSRRYIHQYNFPPFSVGEARFMRGPGRREIGHGALAERALAPVIPDENEFPYTMRVVSEALESNGSTSMASVCGSTLALMDAGVPIRAAVGGIAMGLVAKGDKFTVLTDIQGLEDALGEMDFKVAGTRVGITALQMDIKLKGITIEVLRQALEQAKDARYEILDVLEATIPAPRDELSHLAPRIISFMVAPDKIKDIIGPGGRVINRIIAETGVKIDIENDGRVFVSAVDREKVARAQKMVEDLIRDVEVGTRYTGTVMRIMNFGAFMEILPGKEGLLHISQLKPYHVGKVEDVVSVGDQLEVCVEEIDSMGRINLGRKGLYSEEELAEAEKHGGVRTGGGRGERGPREGGDRGDRPDRGDRGDRPDRGDRGERGPRDRGPRGGGNGNGGGRPRGDYDRPRGEDRPHGDRPARDFDRPREGGEREDRPGRERGDRDRETERPAREDRPARPDRDREDRPARDRDERPARADREDRPVRDRGDRDDRPARGDREDRPARGDREDRPARADRDRGAREDRPARGDREDRPARSENRPGRGDREDRPARGDRDDRPARGGDRDDRPARGDRDDRPGRGGDRDRGDRDRGGDRGGRDDRPARDRDDRPARGEDRFSREDRPVTRDRGDRDFDRPARGGDRDDRPARGGGDRDDRPAPRDRDRDFDRPRTSARPEMPPSLRSNSGGGGNSSSAAADDDDARRRVRRRRPRED